jgi:hypothetical protein
MATKRAFGPLIAGTIAGSVFCTTAQAAVDLTAYMDTSTCRR